MRITLPAFHRVSDEWDLLTVESGHLSRPRTFSLTTLDLRHDLASMLTAEQAGMKD
jgi:hypothetical protein